MAGYWPSSFFAFLCGPIRSRGPYTCKKRTRPISSHLDRTSIYYMAFGDIFLRDPEGSLEWVR